MIINENERVFLGLEMTEKVQLLMLRKPHPKPLLNFSDRRKKDLFDFFMS